MAVLFSADMQTTQRSCLYSRFLPATTLSSEYSLAIGKHNRTPPTQYSHLHRDYLDRPHRKAIQTVADLLCLTQTFPIKQTKRTMLPKRSTALIAEPGVALRTKLRPILRRQFLWILLRTLLPEGKTYRSMISMVVRVNRISRSLITFTVFCSLGLPMTKSLYFSLLLSCYRKQQWFIVRFWKQIAQSKSLLIGGNVDAVENSVILMP